MLKHIESVYRNDALEIRQKARHLTVAITVILSLLPVIAIFDIISFSLVSVLVEGATWLFMIGILVMLFKGKYKIACNITIIMITMAMLVLSLSSSVMTQRRLFIITLYMLCPVILAMLISYSRAQILFTAGIGVPVLTGFFFYMIPHLGPEGFDDLLNTFVSVIVIYLMVIIVLYTIAMTYKKNLSILTAKHRESQDQLTAIRNVVAAASDNVGLSKILETEFNNAFEELSAISSRIEQIRNDVHTLNTNVEGSYQSVNTITGTIGSFNNEVSEQAAVIQQASSSINQMVSSLSSMDKITSVRMESTKGLLTTAGKGMTNVKKTENTFQDLSHSMKDIIDFTAIIEDIATQTNILSMNAAIEAAHAGKFGRGFSIVAGEIRKLAESVSQNSQSIAKSMKKLLDSINNTDQSIQVSSDSFTRVLGEVQEVADTLSEIFNTTFELSAGGQQIISGIEVLNNTAHNIRDESLKIGEEQNKILENIHSVQSLSQNIDEVMNTITSGIHEVENSMTGIRERITASAIVTEEIHNSVNRLKGDG
ncbi:MAG: hypothetical protein JW969_00060 [Spirochaetales bacterium]|nr:hypothetical protein [Spirochaetales bacterium]